MPAAMTETANAWLAARGIAPLVFLASLAISWALVALTLPVFRRFALAVPNARSSHKAVTPQGGGFGVVGATVCVTALALLGSTQLAGTPQGGTWLVLAAAVLLALVGAIDDARHLSPIPKFAGQAVAVLFVIAALPEGMRVCPLLPWTIERAAIFAAGLWFVNLVNFMDGIDWMMVAEVVPVTAGVALVGALGALPPEALIVALALNGAMLGFAPFNRPVARLFLGDMGSLPIGLLLSLAALARGGFGARGRGAAAAALFRRRCERHAGAAGARARARVGGASHALLSARARQRLRHPWHRRPRIRGQLRPRGAGGFERSRALAAGEPRHPCAGCGARRVAARDLRAEAPLSERILITGASGFVGKALVAVLARAGHKVRAATRRPNAVAFPKSVEVVAVPDFRGTIDWGPLLAGIDAVVHLAGIAHVGLDLDPAIYDRVIRGATADLAIACAKANVQRLVFVSSVRAQSGASAPASYARLIRRARPRPTAAPSSLPKPQL